MLKRSLVLLVLVFLAGCDFRATGPSDTEAPALQTVQSSYSVGEAPEVTLKSETPQSTFLPSCGGRAVLSVQKREDGSWESYYAARCLALYTVVFETEVESGEQWKTQKIRDAGTYRIRQRVKQGSNDPQVLFSNEFEVE
jgi:hypothetical protein